MQHGHPFPTLSLLTQFSTSTTPMARPGLRRETWTEPSTGALIDAWEDRFLRLNRGVLRRKDWDEIADCVNRTRRTDGDPAPPVTNAQCRNRVDALKRRFRLERSRSPSPSLWPFYRRLDLLVGASAGEAPIAAELDRGGEEEDLARAVAGLAEVYERTERSRLRLVAELEKQRLEFSKEIEAQRLNLFVDAQLELAKVKAKPRRRDSGTASGKK